MIYQVPSADAAAIQAECPADYPYKVVTHGTRTYTEDAHGWRLARFFDFDAAVAAATPYATFDAWLAGAGTAIGANVNDQFMWLPAISPPITISLAGNGLSHATNPSARRVTVQVIAPSGGPTRARPTVDGVPVAGGAGSFVYDKPGHVLTIETKAGNNDVVILEEF